MAAFLTRSGGAQAFAIALESQELKADVQKDMMKSLISTDTKFIDGIHTGKFISNLTLDVTLLVNLVNPPCL